METREGVKICWEPVKLEMPLLPREHSPVPVHSLPVLEDVFHLLMFGLPQSVLN